MSDRHEEIIDHYSAGSLRARIEAALGALDLDGRPLTVHDLGALTEFHVGGRTASEELIDRLELSSSAHVLDIGSGLGGTAQLIAARTGARVTGVDLTPEFVDTARWLAELIGSSDLIDFVEGTIAPGIDPLALGSETPFAAATMLHVGMNIADKAALVAGVRGLLAPGAPFAIYDLMAGPNDAELDYPVPWSSVPETSRLAPAATYIEALEASGFRVAAVEQRVDFAALLPSPPPPVGDDGPAADPGPPPLNLGLVMGPLAGVKIGNLRTAIADERVVPTVIIAT